MYNIPSTFLRLQKEARADAPDVTLNEIVGCQTDVSIAGLTVAFILCFLALQKSNLDIKYTSRYLSRWSGREKSTLCKLYQIAHILEAAGILKRSTVPREVRLVDRFFTPIEINHSKSGENPRNMYTLESLLVHVRPATEKILEKRMNEFIAELDPNERSLLLASAARS
jgi:hypothetical protein